MDGIYRALLAVVLLQVAAALKDNQTPCCYPKQFTALRESLDTFLDDGTVVIVEGATRMAYDAINEKVAEITDAYNDVTGVTVKTKFIYDYKKKKMYIIQGKDCQVKTLSNTFSESCIPAAAKFDVTVNIGLGDALPVSSFHFLVPGFPPNPNTLVRYSVGTEGCIPYQLGLFATKKGPKQVPLPAARSQLLPTDPLYKWINSTCAPGGTQKLTSAYQYSDYKEGIQPSSGYWFDPPSGCKRQTSGEKKAQPTGKLPRVSSVIRRRIYRRRS